MPTPKFQNSAGRLLALLGSIPSNKPLLEIAPSLLGIKADSTQQKTQATLLLLMELHKVYLEFREDMFETNVNEEQRDVMLSGLASLEQSLYPTQIGGPMRAATEAEISLLKVCATFIDQEEPITEDEIKKIRQSITTLREIVEKGAISPTLRKALLELIRLSEEAISRFNIYGARGLRRAFKAMLADAAELYGMTDSNGEREEFRKSETWKAVVQHLKVVDTVASKLLKYKPILEYASQLLIASGS